MPHFVIQQVYAIEKTLRTNKVTFFKVSTELGFLEGFVGRSLNPLELPRLKHVQVQCISYGDKEGGNPARNLSWSPDCVAVWGTSTRTRSSFLFLLRGLTKNLNRLWRCSYSSYWTPLAATAKKAALGLPRKTGEGQSTITHFDSPADQISPVLPFPGLFCQSTKLRKGNLNDGHSFEVSADPFADATRLTTGSSLRWPGKPVHAKDIL